MAFSGRLLTDAIVALLQTAGLNVYLGFKPDGSSGGWVDDPGASQFIPYSVVYPVTGGYFEGTLCEPFADARPDYIISSFGARPEQAQWGDDLVFETLTTSKPVVVGRVVNLMVPDVQAGVVRDDDVQPPIWHAPTRWRVFETAA